MNQQLFQSSMLCKCIHKPEPYALLMKLMLEAFWGSYYVISNVYMAFLHLCFIVKSELLLLLLAKMYI